MKLGGSSREYMLHWIPISRAYDLENPFVAPLADAEPLEETEEKEHQDERGFVLQNENNDLVQGLDSSLADMYLLPYVKSLTPSSPLMPEEMKSPFHFSHEEVKINLPGKCMESMNSVCCSLLTNLTRKTTLRRPFLSRQNPKQKMPIVVPQ
ncbi:uncharacterized protein LOC132626270 isoform X2 [Lycium barbarum]|nr:uncharacterized protein LOC132626270 isoform X2 [Lycium barbarum]